MFHGGAYVAEATKGHRVLIEELVLKYHFKVTFIEYPLAPENDATITHKIIYEAFKILTKSYQDDFYFLGDSAGGGLALAFLQTLRNHKSSVIPKKTVLLSPWLDVTMSNPEIKNYIDKDVLLQVEGLKACGQIYAAETNLTDPLISPIFGNLENLNHLKVFVSNYELFYPDCILLKNKVEFVEGTKIDLVIKDKMIHDWVVLPIKERNETIAEIAEFYMLD